MSQSTSPSGEVQGHKTLAIRLDLPLHAQLSVIAQLSGHNLTDEIRLAIERHIEAVRSDTALTAKADVVLDEIERDAKARREAIASLFGDQAPPGSDESAKPSRRAEEPPRDSPRPTTIQGGQPVGDLIRRSWLWPPTHQSPTGITKNLYNPKCEEA
jgi:predicted DNA-binding protein